MGSGLLADVRCTSIWEYEGILDGPRVLPKAKRLRWWPEPLSELSIIGCLVKLTGNTSERRIQLGAEAVHDGNDGNGDARRRSGHTRWP